MRLRRIRRWWPAAALLGVLALAWALWPARFKYTVSPQTTYITEPVDANGIPDYVAGLNDRMARDVTPESNANVLIWQALGPHPEGANMPPEYFRRLGVAQPPEQGDYLIPWDKYFQAHLKTPPGDVTGLFFDDDERAWREQWNDRIGRANKWPWRARDEPEFAAWLKANERPLALFVEAGRRPQYYNPLVSKSVDPTSARLIGSLLPNVQLCRAAGVLLSSRAMAKAGEGDIEGGWQDLLACQRLGRMVARGGTLIEELVGISLVTIATNAEVVLIGRGTHEPGQLRRWTADLRALPPMPPLSEKMALSERFTTLDAVLSIACHGPDGLAQLTGGVSGPTGRGGLPGRMVSRSINFDPAFRNTNEMFDRCEAACRLPDRASRKAAFVEIESDLQQRKGVAKSLDPFDRLTMGPTARGEHIGNILITLLLPALGKLLDAADRTEQTQANLRLALALATYRAEAGRYPDRLEDLVPKYLPTIPGDSFSGKPLIYRPAADGYLLYSVGVNGVDEDGRWMEDTPPGDDLRVKMPVEAPRPKKVDGRD